jgi:hypothetical protein
MNIATIINAASIITVVVLFVFMLITHMLNALAIACHMPFRKLAICWNMFICGVVCGVVGVWVACVVVGCVVVGCVVVGCVAVVGATVDVVVGIVVVVGCVVVAGVGLVRGIVMIVGDGCPDSCAKYSLSICIVAVYVADVQPLFPVASTVSVPCVVL